MNYKAKTAAEITALLPELADRVTALKRKKERMKGRYLSDTPTIQKNALIEIINKKMQPDFNSIIILLAQITDNIIDYKIPITEAQAAELDYLKNKSWLLIGL